MTSSIDEPACGAREPEPRTGTSPCVLPAGHGGLNHQDKWTNQWPKSKRAPAETEPRPIEIRCEDAFWTKTPHAPHDWRQRPDAEPVHCPGA
jgi:hypothetical protein